MWKNSCYYFAGTPTSAPLPYTFPLRVIIHGHHPDDKTTDDVHKGKLIHLPDSIEDLLSLAGKQLIENCRQIYLMN